MGIKYRKLNKGKTNMGREYDDNPGELNKGDIAYAVKRFVHDAHQYAKHEEYTGNQTRDDHIYGLRGGIVVVRV